MTFTFDTAAALVRIRVRAAAKAANLAKAATAPPSALAGIAALAGGCGLGAQFEPASPAPDMDRYEELAAILEYDQGLARDAAETAAAEAQGYLDGATLLEVHEAAETQWKTRSEPGIWAATRPHACARHGVYPKEAL